MQIVTGMGRLTASNIILRFRKSNYNMTEQRGTHHFAGLYLSMKYSAIRSGYIFDILRVESHRTVSSCATGQMMFDERRRTMPFKGLRFMPPN